MALAGLQVNLAEVRNISGALARATFATMQNNAEFKAWLDAFDEQDLVDANYAQDLVEASALRSAFTDLGDMNRIWQGLTPDFSIPRDMRVNPRKLIGVGLF